MLTDIHFLCSYCPRWLTSSDKSSREADEDGNPEEYGSLEEDYNLEEDDNLEEDGNP